MDDKELIQKAASVINLRKVGDRLIGDVGAALVSEKGNIYTGICMDLPSGIGFCAEHSAIAAMATAGEEHIQKIVAVWKDKDGQLFVIPPCGRCREFIRQIDGRNIETEVIISPNKTVLLKELLPYHDSWEPVGD
jgi:cytidine deaminase